MCFSVYGHRGLLSFKGINVSEDVYKVIGLNLMKARIVNGLSQSDLAKVLNVSYQQIQKYERGLNRIPLDKLLVANDFLGVSLLDVFADENMPQPEAENWDQIKQENLLLNNFKKLSPAARQSILQMIQSLAAKS